MISLRLITIKTRVVVAEIVNNGTYDLSSNDKTIEVMPVSGAVKYDIKLDGAPHVEGSAPYHALGDDIPWKPAPGPHTIVVNALDAKGKTVETRTVQIVAGSVQPTPTQTRTFTVGLSTTLDAIAAQVKPSDPPVRIQLAANGSGDYSKTINLPTGSRVVKLGDGEPFKATSKANNIALFNIGQGIKDVEISGVTAHLLSSDGDAYMVTIYGEDVRMSDLHVTGRGGIFSVKSGKDVTLKNFTSHSGGLYPLAYGGTRSGKSDTPPPTNITISDGDVISTGADDRTHCVRFSRGAGITLKKIRFSVEKDAAGEYRKINTAVNLKSPGPMTGEDLECSGIGMVFGPLAGKDGYTDDWKTNRTNKVTVKNCRIIDPAAWGIDVDPGIDLVEIIGGEIRAPMCGVNVRGDYWGWDAVNKRDAAPILGQTAPRPASHVTITKSTKIISPVRVKGDMANVTEVP